LIVGRKSEAHSAFFDVRTWRNALRFSALQLETDLGLKIRLSRAGAKKRPYYHIVVADSASPRDGRFIEKLGSYNPMLPLEHAERIRLQDERIKHWVSKGAVPTDRVARFLGTAGIIPMPVYPEQPLQSAPRKKAQERAKAAAAAS
jgi:small subunit ribosomal protein S16